MVGLCLLWAARAGATPGLVGEWLDGPAGLADVSGYSPAGTHDGYVIGAGHYVFTNDVPAGRPGQSLWLYNGDTGMAISNSSTLDAHYTNTFDSQIQNAMTVAVWAKGEPGGWNPWVSKYGEGPGWQLRVDNGNNACWTVRGNAGTITLGQNGQQYGGAEDLATKSIPSSYSGWHLYVGTYNVTTGLRDLYVDGVLSAQETNNGLYNLAPVEHLVLGGKDSPSGNNFGNYGVFEIYDARVYNYDLGSNAVLNLYEGGAPTASIPTASPSTNVFVGNSVVLSELALGTPPLQYQWESNSVVLAWATNSSLVLSNLTLASSPYYSVIVSNSLGAATSAPVVLKILAPSAPIVTANTTPAGSTVAYQYSATTFTAAFTGNTPIRYQWEVSTNNGVTFAPLTGQTNTTLTLTNLALATNEYELVASNALGSAASAPAMLTVLPRPPLQLAGDLIVSLASEDLANGVTATWTNRSYYPVSVGGFQEAGGGALTTATVPWNSVPVTALAVNGNASQALSSAGLSPAEINSNGTFSMEAWIYVPSVPTQQAVLNYGIDGGSSTTTKAETRDFGYGTAAYGGFTAYYGNSDTSWSGPTTGWHYIVVTYDQTTLRLYQDGVANHTGGAGLQTVQTPVEVGQSNGGTDSGGGNIFDGDIAAARVMSGVLTALEVSNNFVAGPLAVEAASFLLSAPSLTPAQNLVYQGATVTLGLVESGAVGSYNYQWRTDGGSGGVAWTNIPGATNASYALPTGNLNAGTYEFDITLSNSASLMPLISPPATLTVLSDAAPPTVQSVYAAGTASVVIVFANPVTAASADNPTNYTFTNGLAVTSASLAPDNMTVTLVTPPLAYGSNYWIFINGIFSGAPTPVEIATNTPVEVTVQPLPNLESVLTFGYDNTRDGANTHEFLLTPQNVNVTNFGRLFTYPVDGYVFAQPLIATNVTVPGQGTHNLLIIATENDTVYALDADNYVATPYWTNSFVDAAAGVVPVPGGDAPGNIYPVIGITATPVIDPATGTIYVEARTQETSGGNVSYVHRLHALDLTTGRERTNYNSPVLISCTNYPGTGTPGQNDTDGAGHILWSGVKENCRPALLLANGLVYITYASPGDHPPYYGWMFTYDARTLAERGVFNDDPNAGYGGIWMTGNGPAADTNGNVYLNTGNGTYDTNSDYGDSILKFNGTNGLTLADYFTPYNAAALSSGDLDVSSAGLLLLPDALGSASHPHLLLSGSKTGTLYLLDRDNLGQFNAAGDSQIVQELSGAVGGMWCSPAYFNGSIYIIGNSDYLKCFTISNAVVSSTPVAQSPNAFGYATPTISANGTNNGIVWATVSSGGSAELFAYNATNVAQELYNSSQNAARDNAGSAVEFTLPTVVNGKVYLGAQYSVSVFGLNSFAATPTISPDGGVFTNSVMVTLDDATEGAEIYYTLDGSVPTTDSAGYSGPFTLTNSALVRAVAAVLGSESSGVAEARFINSSALGSGTGLSGAYWWNTTSTAFTNLTFINLPALVRTDATVNFNWGGTGPAPGAAGTNYVVRWTGTVQPQFSETYTFYATADDGVILYVNGQPLVNEWVDEAATTYQGSIPLNAQQLYNIELEYFYQNDNGAQVSLAWSSPSTPQTVIPESQLYPYTNPPPTVVLASPTNGSSYTAAASVTIGAMADAPNNPISTVAFYTNGVFLAALSNSLYAPLYEVTVTGLGAGSYALTAVATDGSGLGSTSAPVNITVAAGTGLPYGVSATGAVPGYYNMPETIPAILPGSLPLLLSQTGVFSNTPAMTPAGGLIYYEPNVQLFSDNAAKIRYLSVPDNGGNLTPDQQISFAPTGAWLFPAGTVFVKTFELQTNLTTTNSLLRLETRLLVRDVNGGVYGVTYKWRPDYSDADLLTTSSNQTVVITTANGAETNTWYYPSPKNCLSCHTAVANYVLGVNTRQLNKSVTYPATGVTDNELRSLNHLGLFNPAFDEGGITNLEAMSALTNQAASLLQRARSYLDANCAQCHQPGGSGPTFDARFDTPLAAQNLTNYPALASLGNDNECIIRANDIWRSSIYSRINIVDENNPSGHIQMPPLARLLIDTNALSVLAEWINSLPGLPTLAPPTITPSGGMFSPSVSVTLQSTNSNATLYYTLNGTLPTTNSFVYSAPFILTNTATVMANAIWTNFNNSIAANARFTVNPPILFTSELFLTNGVFQLGYSGMPGGNYVLQATTNLVNWTSLVTNPASTNLFMFSDPGATNFPHRFYRILQQ